MPSKSEVVRQAEFGLAQELYKYVCVLETNPSFQVFLMHALHLETALLRCVTQLALSVFDVDCNQPEGWKVIKLYHSQVLPELLRFSLETSFSPDWNDHKPFVHTLRPTHYCRVAKLALFERQGKPYSQSLTWDLSSEYMLNRPLWMWWSRDANWTLNIGTEAPSVLC